MNTLKDKINLFILTRPLWTKIIFCIFIFICIKILSYAAFMDTVVNKNIEPLILTKAENKPIEAPVMPISDKIPPIQPQSETISSEILKEHKATLTDHAITFVQIIVFVLGVYALYKISQSVLDKVKSISYTTNTSDTTSTSSESSLDSYGLSESGDDSLMDSIPEYLTLSLIIEMLPLYRDVAPLFAVTCFPLIEAKLTFISMFISSNLPSDIDPRECIKQMQVIVDQALRDGTLSTRDHGCFTEFKISWLSYHIFRDANLLIIPGNSKAICEIYDQISDEILKNYK